MAPAILQPNRNVWRTERAARAAALIDGAAFFDAVRQAFRNARHSIFVLGWDIDSRMRLVGETDRPDDGLPATLGEFLTELVRRRPELKVNLLFWDYSLLYAGERELFPRLVVAMADARADQPVPRQYRAVRLLTASENHRGRQRAGVLRRARSDYPPLGYHRPLPPATGTASIRPGIPSSRFTTCR